MARVYVCAYSLSSRDAGEREKAEVEGEGGREGGREGEKEREEERVHDFFRIYERT